MNAPDPFTDPNVIDQGAVSLPDDADTPTVVTTRKE